MNKRVRAQDPGHQGRNESSGLPLPIERQYTVCDRAAIARLLGEQPQLLDVLDELAGRIPTYFRQAHLFLRVVECAPTRDAPDGRRLVLFIATDLGFEDAMDRIDRLMAAWKPDTMAATPGPFSVDVVHGTTTADLEEAAERFSRTHGGGKSMRGDLARRLLHAEPGSLEEALARAELAAALAEERGEPAATRGVDALSVSARLRQRADTEP